MKYIFWNTNRKKDINKYIEKIIEIYAPDFFGMAEYIADGKTLEIELKKKGLNYVYIPRIGSRLDMLYKGDASDVIHCSEREYYTIKIIPYERKRQIISVVHFPSKMYPDESGNAEIMRDMLQDIQEIKDRKQIKGIIILGDFNMNPFEAPMIEATALQAISSSEIVVQKKKRRYRGKEREFFYNPMWNFLGDEKKPIGSFYYKSPQNSAFYWNTFDQFVVNEILANHVILDRIKFIEGVGDMSLQNKKGEPSVSDHFPLFFELKEKRDEKFMDEFRNIGSESEESD